MPQLYLFNPGHETEVLCGKSHYTPPYTIQKMTADLELLPVWYGGKGNFVLVRNLKASNFINSLPKIFKPSLASPMIMSVIMKELYKRKKLGEKLSLPPLTSSFWGISPKSISTFNELKQAGMEIEIPEWKEDYAELTKRQISAECLIRLQKAFPITPAIEIPQFFSDIESIKKFVKKGKKQYLVKTPFSSSGRGLYWLKEGVDNRAESWINGALKKQGSVSLEPILDKIIDFAAEFYSDGNGEIRYVGLSIFETQAQGQFTGCMLGTQEILLQRLNEFISPEDYLFLVKQIRQVLQDVIGTKYTGYMGVDMMIYKTEKGDYAVHPFVELNLRYTMGIAAIQLSRQFLHPEARGLFRIIYYVYGAQKEHQRMEESSPLIIENDKIRSGYLSLCPVNQDTRYMAMIDVFE